MMGPRQERKPKLFYTDVNLEERVHPEHPLRKIAAAVDFAFVRGKVAALYGTRGNPSLDPTLVLKMLFLLFYENVASERELLRQLPCRLDWLWFLQMDLDHAIPDHSVLSKARRRWGQAVFAGFFQEVLAQCLHFGLVDGSRVHVDGSLIAANADRGKLTLALKFHGESLYGQLEQAAAPGDDPGSSGGGSLSPAAGDPGLPAAAADKPAQDAADQDAADQDATAQDAADQVPPGTLYSPTDPEARLTKKNGRCILGYKDHRVVDDRCGIITASITTAATVSEDAMLLSVLDEHEDNTGLKAFEPTADKQYGTVENYVALQAQECRPCIPHAAVREDKSKFPRAMFIYEAQADVYHCPAGQLLKRRGAPSEGRYRYQADPGVCQSCPLREACTASSKQRVLSRQVHQEAIEWADGCWSRGERRRRMARRKSVGEGSFADATNHHGYKRARWRGRERVAMQNLMIASIQNVRKLLKYGRRYPNHHAGRLPGCRLAASIPSLHFLHQNPPRLGLPRRPSH